MNTNEHENFRRCRQKRLPEPLNRSRRRESALILCRESNQVRRLTSAATRFMESPLSFFACIGTMNQIGTPLPALSPPGGERVAEGRERGGSWRASIRFCARIGTMNRCASQRRGPDRGSATRSLLGSWRELPEL